jgi:protein phosphatase
MRRDSDADTAELPVAEAPPDPPLGSISALVEVDLGGASHAGKVRPNNEDHFFVARFDRAMQTLLTNLRPGLVPDRAGETAYGMLVADGIGGAVAGEVASSTAVSAMLDLVLRTPDWIMRLDEEEIRVVLQRFEQRFRAVARVLVQKADDDPSLAGMGTTLTLAASLGHDLLIAHVGDSRAYLFRKGQLHRLTRDQTVAQALADLGDIRPEDVARHPLGRVLTSALTAKGQRMFVELQHFQLQDADQVLLCSDGLTGLVSEAAMSEVLQRTGTAAAACDALIGLALDAGGTDNITVVLARYHIPETPSATS